MNKEEKLKEGNRLLRKHLSKSATKLKTAEKVVKNDSLSTSLELASVKAGSTLPSTKGLREISKELNGLVSQPLLDGRTKSSPGRYTSSPSFLTSGEHPIASTNGAGVNHQSHNDTIESERKLWTNEKESLQKQIQAHTETVNMLVSEKTSLQTQLNHLQKELSDRTREHSKTQTDLQACQLRLRTASEEQDKLVMKRSQEEQEMKSLSEQLAQTQRELQQAKYDIDERKQENTEMTSKLTLQAAELLQVQTANAELQAKLKMAELLTQQLSEGTSPTNSKTNPLQEQQLQRLSNELEQCKSTISRITTERDRALTEIRQLSNTLHEQEQQYNQQCTVLQQQCKEQRDQLEVARETIASVQSEKDTSLLESSSQLSQIQETTQAQMEQLQAEVLHLKAQLEQQVQNNANLSRLNAEQEDVVVRLEGQLSWLKEQSVDHQQLLNTITNDKETISRVLVQNNELKNQLAELQDGFVKMSQQNMELASELHSERHTCKELREQYEKEQEENSRLSQQLASLQYDEGHSKQSQDTTDFIGDLPNEDEGLTFSLPPIVSSTPPAVEEREELIRQLQAEKDAMAAKLTSLTEEHTRVTAQLYQRQQKETDIQALQEENQDEITTDNEITTDTKHIAMVGSHELEQFSPQNVAQLQTNFAALQDRFTQLMTEKADLLDQLQHYEHINIQLENETETIGEYIILYQKQRESLKKKFEQKDRFITQLIGEKETLQGKLVELQELVRQLLNEQQQEVHQHMTPQPVAMVTHETESSEETHVVATDLDNVSKASTPESFLLLENPNLEIATRQQHSTNTANQILTLLHEIESSSKTHHQLIIPCHCCVGELVSV